MAFNSNGGTSVPRQRVKKGDTATQPTNPTKTGYTFVEWDLGTNAYNFSTPVTSNLVLSAKWQINQYTVTFDSDGGSAVASQTVDYGGKATEPSPAPTKAGYTFVEWQLGGDAYDFNTAVTSNITLVATWEEIVTYTVTFSSNGGSSVEAQTVVSGQFATEPDPAPTKDGYDFVMWCKDEELRTEFVFTAEPIVDDITLYAKWNVDPEPVWETDYAEIYLVSPAGGRGILKYELIGGSGEEEVELVVGGGAYHSVGVDNPGDALSTKYTSIAVWNEAETASVDLKDRTITGKTEIGVAVPVVPPDDEQQNP